MIESWLGLGYGATSGVPRRLIEVFTQLVELEFGDRMDESVEKWADSELARRAAEMDAKGKELRGTWRTWISTAFTEGTARFDHFSRAYSVAYTELAVRAERHAK